MVKRALKVVPIGVVESADELAKIKIFEEFHDGLYKLDGFSHLIVLYWLHERDTEKERRVIRVVPKRHQAHEEVGVFASRSPSRPNPIALCVVRLLKIDGCSLTVGGLAHLTVHQLLTLNPTCQMRISFLRPRLQNGQVTENRHRSAR